MTSALWNAQAHMPSVEANQIVVTRGDGAYIETTDGRRLFDATAGLWHANVGHGRADLAEVAATQMRRLETYHVFHRFANDVACELADRLRSISPIENAKVIFGSGGSEAVEAACKLARRYWQVVGKPAKQHVLSREFAYHGNHAFGSSIGGLDFIREGYGPTSLVRETERFDHLNLEHARSTIERIGPDHIAAIVCEPIMGTGGVYPPPPGYLAGLQALARQHDILLILDEVITGFGRTGEMFATSHFGLEPDMLLMAKGITSGYVPLGGVLVAPRVWAPFWSSDGPIYRHGTTYAGHAVACAVALKHLAILKTEHLLTRVVELSRDLASALGALPAMDGVAEVRHHGLLAGIELEASVDAEDVVERALQHGVIFRLLRGRTLQVSPPYISTKAEIQRVAEIAALAITESKDNP